MIVYTRSFRLLTMLVWSFIGAKAQDTPLGSAPEQDFAEFNKRAVAPIEGGIGFSSQQFKALFSIQASPQLTVVRHYLRVGATVGAAYTAIAPNQQAETWTGYAGPKLSFKLTQLGFALNGLPGKINYANLNVFVEHLWGGNGLKLFGGGLSLELLKKASVSLKLHRDYAHQSTWGQVGLSYNFIPQKKEKTFQNSN